MAPDDDRLGALADRVVEALLAAGLPLHVDDPAEPTRVGVRVEVDRYLDGDEGVFVSWVASDAVRDSAMHAVAELRLDDPAIGRSGRMSVALLRAVEEILWDHGLATAPTDEYRPIAARVVDPVVDHTPGRPGATGGIAEAPGMVAAWAGVFTGTHAEFWSMLDERWIDPDDVRQELGDAVGVGRYLPGLHVARVQDEIVDADRLLALADVAEHLVLPLANRLDATGVRQANAFVCVYHHVMWPRLDRYRGLQFLGNLVVPETAGLVSPW